MRVIAKQPIVDTCHRRSSTTDGLTALFGVAFVACHAVGMHDMAITREETN